MTILTMSDYERIVVYYLRCRVCRAEFESLNREDLCRVCDGPTEVFGLKEKLVKRLPETA